MSNNNDLVNAMKDYVSQVFGAFGCERVEFVDAVGEVKDVINIKARVAKMKKNQMPIEIATDIAKKHLLVKTLTEQKSDRLDFHEVSVTGIKDALNDAFLAGQKSLYVQVQVETFDNLDNMGLSKANVRKIKKMIKSVMESAYIMGREDTEIEME